MVLFDMYVFGVTGGRDRERERGSRTLSCIMLLMTFHTPRAISHYLVQGFFYVAGFITLQACLFL